MPAALISDHHPEVPGHRSRACPRSALNALVSKSPKSTDSHPLRMAVSMLSGRWCQSASKFDPRSASNFDPLERRVLTVALAPPELVGVAETARARIVG